MSQCEPDTKKRGKTHTQSKRILYISLSLSLSVSQFKNNPKITLNDTHVSREPLQMCISFVLFFLSQIYCIIFARKGEKNKAQIIIITQRIY